MTERKMGPQQSENEDCPRFIAMVSDSYVESSNDLEELIALVKADGLGSAEDCCFWDNFHTVAAVIRSDGSVHRFSPTKPIQDGITGRILRMRKQRPSDGPRIA